VSSESREKEVRCCVTGCERPWRVCVCCVVKRKRVLRGSPCPPPSRVIREYERTKGKTTGRGVSGGTTKSEREKERERERERKRARERRVIEEESEKGNTRVAREASGENSSVAVRSVKGSSSRRNRSHDVVLHPGRRGRGRGAHRAADRGRHHAPPHHPVRPVPRYLRPQVPQSGVPYDAWRSTGRRSLTSARKRLGQGDLLLRIP